MSVAFVGQIFGMYIDVNLGDTAIDPASKSCIELLQILIEDFIKSLFFFFDKCILVNQLNQLLKPVLIGYEIDYQIGLKIGEAQIGTVLCPRESRIQISYMQQLILFRGTYQIQSLASAPVRSALTFFINRNSLGEPARHSIACHLQGDYMHELMPDDFLPICRKCIGRDQCDHLPEADSD